ncbi:hypothetical protein [Roseomonas fluvialis]|uniref:Uncharacterized protein n=1 Tax=Roseomonas fluvialis TaxID=1750527 RepID=A0ABN6P8C4_9PROT|nr:hypothetical protein [Roseomonas fluvialis]BDG75144.1 hypothetical protein Rmf_50730 [Roseomonas fluvialis]
MHDRFAGLPGWAAAVAWRLDFFARGRPRARHRRRALRRTLQALRARSATPDDEARALAAFCNACLGLAQAGVAARPDLMVFAPAVARLCTLARDEIAGSRDDRPLMVALEALLAAQPDMPWPLGALPGRAVFLANMAQHVPAEAPAAAAMLVNDLATLGADLPRLALEAAAAAG